MDIDTIKISSDPSPLKMSICKANESTISENNIVSSNYKISRTATTYQASDSGAPANMEGNNSIAKTTQECAAGNNVPLKAPTMLVGREKRNLSPTMQETFVDPQSPSSSSSTSQATSANDATFEPTIEMMVNDFDDEQTLNEEEALAALESQDPDEEINTLKEESEMPLEELLAKYSALPPLPPTIEPLRKKSKKSSSSSHKKKHKSKQKHNVRPQQTPNDSIEQCTASNEVDDPTKHAKANLELNNAENVEEKDLPEDKKVDDYDEEGASSPSSPRKPTTPSLDEERKEDEESAFVNENGIHSEILKVRRSHLLDLYPEGTFDNVVINDAIAGNSKESLYGVEDDDEDEEIEEEEDEDYKKKVMIGTSYQATIPVGLSQYGDILPYENEDKLIWEPSQVSEREVEEYLIKIRDIKSNQQGDEEEDEDSVIDTNLENQSKENSRADNNKDNLENNSFLANGNKLQLDTAASLDMDSQAVVKDNEQALHLLVQCGYDFKEALRRKRLNALPLNDCMSLWSEEECHKFEEGIQKYGKDFLKIRQHQVRTRTMRELVQFYYLWKKSERRDHNFANADTVDHMDIYLNEDNEYGSNSTSAVTPVGSPVANISNCTSTRRNSNASQKNFSIMTTTTSTNNTTSTATINLNLEKPASNTSQQQHHKRRTNNSCITACDFSNDNSGILHTNTTK